MSNYNQVECLNHTYTKHKQKMITSCGGGFGICEYCDKSIKLVNGTWFNEGKVKPVTLSPVYTQEMADNGELPMVGMSCLYAVDGSINRTFTECDILFAGEYKIVLSTASVFEKVVDVTLARFKPITPPIELIDGKAYQFDYRSLTGVNGVYSSVDDSFYNSIGAPKSSKCTNIKLLEVKS